MERQKRQQHDSHDIERKRLNKRSALKSQHKAIKGYRKETHQNR